MPEGKPGDVLEYSVLKNQPRSDEALVLLKKIHSLVKPIMRSHGWILPKLVEIFPAQAELLGVNYNRGQKIAIRLRPANDPNSFMGLEEMLIGTMLHELTHNIRAPHDATFWKEYGKLNDEFDKLQANGYAGEGFHGKGTRVGEGVSHDKVSVEEARKIALKKYEQRAKLARLLGKGGKLGGAVPDLKGKKLSEVMADAAERRMKAVKGCGAGGHSHGTEDGELSPEMLAEITKASRESRTYTIDLTQDSDDEDIAIAAEDSGIMSGRLAGGKERVKRPIEVDQSSEEGSDDDIQILSSPAKGKRTLTSAIPSTSKLKSSVALSKTQAAPPKQLLRPAKASSSSNQSSDARSERNSRTPPSGWQCPECTFMNPSPFALQCEVCLHERSSDYPQELYPRQSKSIPVQEDGWTCAFCQIVMEDKFWMCRSCQRIKSG